MWLEFSEIKSEFPNITASTLYKYANLGRVKRKKIDRDHYAYDFDDLRKLSMLILNYHIGEKNG